MRTALTLLLLAASAAPALGAEKVVLENGLTVLLEHRPAAPAVAVTSFVRAGRRHEPKGLAGAAHLTEHMLFRATARRPEGDGDRAAWRVGARLRAATHGNYVKCGLVVPSHELDLALDLLSDMLVTAEFRPEEVEEERSVVIDEIAKRNATAEGWAFEELTGLTFLPHPYGARLAGTARSVAAISRDDLYAFYRRHYRPDRTLLVLAGDFDREEALKRIRAFFGAWRSEGEPPPEPAPPPRRFGHYQEMTVTREGATPVLLASAVLPGFLHRDYLPTRFLRELIGGWVTRRLVIEERVAVSADVYYTFLIDRALLRFRIQLKDSSDAGRARDVLLSLLREFRGPRHSFSGHADVAGNLESRQILLAENLEGLAAVVGQAGLAGFYDGDGLPEHLVAPDRYRRITPEDVKRTARTYLVPANLRVVFLLPTDSEPPAAPRLSGEPGPEGIPDPGEITRVPPEDVDDSGAPGRARPVRDEDAFVSRLPRGPTLLHLERPSSPLVAMTIAFPGGSSLDPEGKEGLAAVTLNALSLETRGDPAYRLRWRRFAMGNRWEFAVDRDTARITFVVPREHAAEAIRITARMVLEPLFTDDAIEEARGGLLREATRERDQVASFAFAEFRKAVLLPRLAHAPHGTTGSLRAIRREDVLGCYRSRLVLGRAVVAVVGSLSHDETRRMLEKASADREAAPLPYPRPAATARAEPRTIHLEHPSGRGYAVLGARAPSLGANGFAAASILRLALGWIVYDELTNRSSMAYEAGAFHLAYDGASEGAGAFAVYAGARRETLPEVRAALLAAIEGVREKGVPDDLLRDARGARLGGADLQSVRSDLVTTRLAFRAAAGAPPFDAVVDRIRALTAKDLHTLCREMLHPERLFTVLVNAK